MSTKGVQTTSVTWRCCFLAPMNFEQATDASGVYAPMYWAEGVAPAISEGLWLSIRCRSIRLCSFCSLAISRLFSSWSAEVLAEMRALNMLSPSGLRLGITCTYWH